MTVVETVQFLRDAGGMMSDPDRALLAMYGKSEKANLSEAEQNAMAKVDSAIVQGYPKGRAIR